MKVQSQLIILVSLGVSDLAWKWFFVIHTFRMIVNFCTDAIFVSPTTFLIIWIIPIRSKTVYYSCWSIIKYSNSLPHPPFWTCKKKQTISPLHVGISLRSALRGTLSGSLSVTLADESWKFPPIECNKYNWYVRWRHIEKIVLSKCSYIFDNFDLIQGVRLFLELARKIGLITMMKYQNFEKKIEK